MKFRDAINICLRPLQVELKKCCPGTDRIRDIQTALRNVSAPVIFDGGAHHGETLDKLYRHFPQATFHAFEPFPEAFKTLHKKWGNHPQVTLYPDALGPEDCESVLHLNQESATNSLLKGNEESPFLTPTRQSIPIKQRTIDSLLSTLKIERVDLLKLDCQGYESRILQGSRQSLLDKKISMIYTEVIMTQQYENQCYFEDLVAMLRKHELQLVALYNGRRNSSGHLLWSDALFSI